MSKLKLAKRKVAGRREFFRSAGAGLLASGVVTGMEAATPADIPPVRFIPSGGLTRLSPNLYLLRDTCNVYVLKNGDRALLIDFGSGHVLNLLGEIGVWKVDGILHTHHHRDQCQGDRRAVAQRIPIHVPAHERHLFEDAENFWRNRRVFHLYRVRNDFFTVTQNIPVAGVLADYERFKWGPSELLIYPTPGHTLGSVTLIGTVDDRTVAFSGDLIHSPGKVVNLYELQYDYGSPDGVDFAIFSLSRLRELAPEVVCPSHGEPFASPEEGISALIGKLKGWYESYSPGSTLTSEAKPFAVTPHLICAHQTTSSFYALISDSGKALFVDYGSGSWNFFSTFMNAAPANDRIRFVEHTIPELKARYGLKSVDVAMPSHMHDDHLNGFPYLARHYGTKVWCFENMVDILERPRGSNLGCILAEPIRVDRSFRHGERFRWEEFEFSVYHSPGHTEYQMAMFAEIDGARIAFTGDAFFPVAAGAPYQLRHNLIFRNWVENDSHVKSIRTILEHQPTMIAPGHGKPFVANKEDLEDLKKRVEGQQAYFESVVADPDVNFGLNPSWVRLDPYQAEARPGEATTLEVHVRNYRAQAMQIEAALVVPPGWKVAPETVKLTAPPKGKTRGSFAMTVPAGWDRTAHPRVAIAADVEADGQYLGQIAEGVVDIL